MTDYPLDMQLVVDPLNPDNVVANGSVFFYDPSDTAGTTPIAIKDPSGLPLPNPLTSNAYGFIQPTIVTIPRVKWKSGAFEGFFYSYDGLRNEAVAARGAAETAASTAGTAAVADVAARVAAGQFKGAPGKDGADGSNVIPTDDAIEAAIKGTGTKTKAALNATFVPKWKTATAYLAGDPVLSPTGDVVTSIANHTSGATFTPANWNTSPTKANTADVVPKWAPATAYTSGQRVTSPDGANVRAKAAFTSASTYDSNNWEYGTITGGSNIPVIKSSTDTRPGVWEYTHNSTTGYLFHLLAGANFGAPAAILAIGNDNGTGTSLLLPNKAGGKAIVIDQRSTVVSATAYGMQATQSSTAAPLVRLEQNVPDAAPALQVLAFNGPTDTQTLAYFGDATGEAGQIRALSGRLEWKRQIIIQDKDGTAGGASYLDVTDNNGVPANTRAHTLIKKGGPEYYGYSGAAGQWWPFSMNVAGSRLRIQSAGLTTTVGTPGTMVNLIEFQNGKMAFFNAATVAQPTRAGAITDSSGGTSGGATIAAVTDVATAANAIATLTAKYNALEAKLSAAAGGLGLTA